MRRAVVLAVAAGLAASPPAPAIAGKAKDERIPMPKLKLAPPLFMPGSPQAESRIDQGLEQPPAPPFVDSNSPAYWVGSNFVLLHSAGAPVISVGSSVEDFRSTGRPFFSSATSVDPQLIDTDITVQRRRRIRGGFWIESVYPTADGSIYGFYHFEPTAPICPGRELTDPFIGAAVSTDQGRSWRDLGLVLAAPTDSIDCATPNEYFAGGVGDFTVLERKGYLYFMFSSYPAPIDQQGVGVARLAVENLASPVGHVAKWYEGGFTEPGLGGRITPAFPVEQSWHSAQPEALWGPSVHWNTYLKRYVALLNFAQDPEWGQRGIYVSFNRNIADPEGWSKPRRILDGGEFYPQVIGTDLPGEGTDRLAGKKARLFLHGYSEHVIRFRRPE
jgi:hypothetical protein